MADDRLGELSDDALPGLAALVATDAPGPVLAALAAVGATLLSASPCHISYRPGRSATVRYDATVSRPGRGTANEALVATTGDTLPAGAVVVEDGDARVAVWRVPHDPGLPGLASALDQVVVRALLDDLGVAPGAVDVHLRAYRPLRRAVVEVVTPGSRLFLKVVPPGRAEALHRHHVALSSEVPAPRSHGWSAELGVVALQALPGRTMRRALGGGGGPRPGPGAVLALLDALPPVAGRVVSPPSASAARHGQLVAAVVPDLTMRVGDLVQGVDGGTGGGTDDEVPVHGDLHDAQLLVDGGRITGLLDIDTVGPGQRTTDLATLIGHLSTLALSSPRRPAVERYAAQLLAGFDAMVDPAGLRREVAAVVLGLATGPFRVQEPGWAAETARRVTLAERWLVSATSRRELSSAPHHPLTGAGHDGP